ncbi:hypothetical protein POTOM_023336 [Populus tomentosa]|uniref:THO1-MOS11 C-terminal domain-containing protein n=1 Tax=Populus tomentosa TaxID=118781 RepID=A0A8X7ZMS6_POPTO|nr:hypothetical protein POTOM_023336 [Populus tomentosa]
MATETENPSTAAVAAITVEDNPSKTLDTAVPASTKPDRVEDSTNTASSTVDSATEGPMQGADNSKSAAPATDTDKKIRRAERFGITVQLSEKEKRNSRAESGNVCAELDFPFQLTEIVICEPFSGMWRCFIGDGVCLQCAFGSSTGDFVNENGSMCGKVLSGSIEFVCANGILSMEMFGTGSQGPESESDSVKKSEELKRKARAERFGIPVPPTTTAEETKKKARHERVAPAPKIDALEENKRKARALRFSQSSSGSLPMNGKGDLEPKAAIAGKAGGGS